MPIMSKPDIQIRVDGRVLSMKHGISLMEALVAAGFLLRSDCGGRVSSFDRSMGSPF